MGDLSDRIRAHRVALGLTQEQAAERSGVSVSTWRRLESGANVRELSLAAVAAALDVDLDDLHTASTQELLRRITVATERTGSAQEAMSDISAELQDYIAHERVAYVLRRGEAIQTVATAGSLAGTPPGTVVPFDSDPATRALFDRGQPVRTQLEDPGSGSPARRALYEAGVRSSLLLPSFGLGRTIGFTILSSRRPAAFDDVDMALALQLGRVIGHVMTTVMVAQSVTLTPDDEQLTAELVSGLTPAQRAALREFIASLRTSR